MRSHGYPLFGLLDFLNSGYVLALALGHYLSERAPDGQHDEPGQKGELGWKKQRRDESGGEQASGDLLPCLAVHEFELLRLRLDSVALELLLDVFRRHLVSPRPCKARPYLVGELVYVLECIPGFELAHVSRFNYVQMVNSFEVIFTYRL